MAESPGAAGHAREAEIGGVGEHGGHQGSRIVRRRAGPQMQVTIPGKFFTGFIMEIIGRRWTITYCLAGAVPGLALMGLAHRTGPHATVVMTAGAIITGLTVLSSFTAVRVYLSEQFPTALRGRGHFFGEATGRLFSGVLTPFLLEPHTGSPTIFFGTIMVVVAVGACVPLLFGRETDGQLELVTEANEEPAL